jgi:hypothetical protein
MIRGAALVPALALALAGCSQAVVAEQAAAPSPTGPINEWSPHIAVVFAQPAPGHNTPGASYAVNVSVWPTNKVLCAKPPNPEVQLIVSKNDQPGDVVAKQPSIVKRDVAGVSFPSAEYNDVSANLVADPSARFSFVVFERGQPASNVWLHGASAANPFVPLKPTGYGSPDPSALDSVIQVVFPHDSRGQQAQPATATAVNVAVDLFQHGTTLSVSPDATHKPVLWWAQGSGELQTLKAAAVKTTYTVNGQGYPRWVFNDLQVQPGQVYHLLATVGQFGQRGGSYPSIWTYGATKSGPVKSEPPPSCIP